MMKCVNKLEKINDTYTTDFGELLKEWTDNVYNTGATEYAVARALTTNITGIFNNRAI